MLTLWQTEWCRSSQCVRQRLTEYDLDVVLRQVPADPGDRLELELRCGVTSVPLLEVENGCVIVGAANILAWREEHYEPGPDAVEHRKRYAERYDMHAALPPGLR
jgi:glutathione S-transferase